MKLSVRVTPNAKTTQLIAWHDHTLFLRLAAPPIDNRANIALVSFLAELFSLPKTSILLHKGSSSRTKLVDIPLDAPMIQTRILSALARHQPHPKTTGDNAIHGPKKER